MVLWADGTGRGRGRGRIRRRRRSRRGRDARRINFALLLLLLPSALRFRSVGRLALAAGFALLCFHARTILILDGHGLMLQLELHSQDPVQVQCDLVLPRDQQRLEMDSQEGFFSIAPPPTTGTTFLGFFQKGSGLLPVGRQAFCGCGYFASRGVGHNRKLWLGSHQGLSSLPPTLRPCLPLLALVLKSLMPSTKLLHDPGLCTVQSK